MFNPFTAVPGLPPTQSNAKPGYRSILAINKSGGELTTGMVCVLDPTAANWGEGLPIPVTTTTSANVLNVAGAVPAHVASVANGAVFELQVAGYHPTLKVDGTTDLANGDFLGTFTTAGAVQKSTTADAICAQYVDAAYTTNSVAAKKAFLINRLGLGMLPF